MKDLPLVDLQAESSQDESEDTGASASAKGATSETEMFSGVSIRVRFSLSHLT